MSPRSALSFIVLAACGGSATSESTPSPGQPPGDPSPSNPSAEVPCGAPPSDIAVASEDLNGYPPYAVSGCSLVYVSTSRGLVRVAVEGAWPTLLPTGDPALGRPALDPVSWTVYVQTRKNAEPARVVAIEP